MSAKYKLLAVASALLSPSICCAAVTVSTDEVSFDAIRNVSKYAITGTGLESQNYIQNGVSFQNISGGTATGGSDFGSGVNYYAANFDQTSGGTPLTVTFNGTVLGLKIGSYFGAQSVAYTVLNGPSGTLAIPGNRALAFFGIDTGGPSGISVTFFPSEELDITAFQTAVPEAATWAMMMVGMGVVGGSLRRRQKVNTRVSFA